MPIRLTFADPTSLLPSADVAIKRPPPDNPYGQAIATGLGMLQKSVNEYRDAKLAETQLDSYASYYRSKNLNDVADLIDNQKALIAPNYGGAISGQDTNKIRQSVISGANALAEKEMEFGQQIRAQDNSFKNQRSLQNSSNSNILDRAREERAENRDVKATAIEIDALDSEEKQLNQTEKDTLEDLRIDGPDKAKMLLDIQNRKEALKIEKEKSIQKLRGPRQKQFGNGEEVTDDYLPSSVSDEPPSSALFADTQAGDPKKVDLSLSDNDPPKDLSNSIPADASNAPPSTGPNAVEQPKVSAGSKVDNTLDPITKAKLDASEGFKSDFVKSSQVYIDSITTRAKANLNNGRITQEEYDETTKMGVQGMEYANAGDVKSASKYIQNYNSQVSTHSGRSNNSVTKDNNEIPLDIPKAKNGSAPFRFLLKGDMLSIQAGTKITASPTTLSKGEKINLKKVATDYLLNPVSDGYVKEVSPIIADAIKNLPESVTLEELRALIAGEGSTPQAQSALPSQKTGILNSFSPR